MRDNEVRDLLVANGAEIEKGYCLVNNYGWIFRLNGHRYDARFWANVYGFARNEWEIMCAETPPVRMDPDLKARLELKMNTGDHD